MTEQEIKYIQENYDKVLYATLVRMINSPPIISELTPLVFIKTKNININVVSSKLKDMTASLFPGWYLRNLREVPLQELKDLDLWDGDAIKLEANKL